MQPKADWENALNLAINVTALGLTLYLLWTYVPETTKIELRAAGHQVTAPFRAAEANRKARAEMMSDVIELGTFGVPGQWTRKVA